jgi:hypothetical protein
MISLEPQESGNDDYIPRGVVGGLHENIPTG